jgi:hypothetical protein
MRVLDGVMRAATHAADAPVAIAFAVGLALGAVPALRSVGLIALFTLVVSHLAVQALKRTVNRARPISRPARSGYWTRPTASVFRRDTRRQACLWPWPSPTSCQLRRQRYCSAWPD